VALFDEQAQNRLKTNHYVNTTTKCTNGKHPEDREKSLLGRLTVLR
jgi:hypothetical protein